MVFVIIFSEWTSLMLNATHIGSKKYEKLIPSWIENSGVSNNISYFIIAPEYYNNISQCKSSIIYAVHIDKHQQRFVADSETRP